MAPVTTLDNPDVQLVCVVWGDRYGTAEINHFFRSAIERSRARINCVCITEYACEGLDNFIQIKRFPAFSLPLEQMKEGCRAKLAMFAPGILLPNVPALFFDLDTIISGDICRLASEVESRKSLFVLKNHSVPFWRVQKFMRPVLRERYYFGNSSVVGFIPRDFEHIYHSFNKDVEALNSLGAALPKRLVSDERHISYAARDRLRVWNVAQVVAFHREFMSSFLWLAELRKKLPWRATRRQNLIALTFIGLSVKPREIASFQTGQIVRVKRQQVRWSFDAYQNYWRRALVGQSERELDRQEAA